MFHFGSLGVQGIRLEAYSVSHDLDSFNVDGLWVDKNGQRVGFTGCYDHFLLLIA